MKKYSKPGYDYQQVLGSCVILECGKKQHVDVYKPVTCPNSPGQHYLVLTRVRMSVSLHVYITPEFQYGPFLLPKSSLTIPLYNLPVWSIFTTLVYLYSLS